KSALVAGHDLFDEPVEITKADVSDVTITLTDRPLSMPLAGSVHDASGAPARDATIAIFPVDRALWTDTFPGARRFRTVRPLAAGTFTIGALPAGEYFIAAVAGDWPQDWQDAKHLQALVAGAERVTVGTGPTQPVSLVIK